MSVAKGTCTSRARPAAVAERTAVQPRQQHSSLHWHGNGHLDPDIDTQLETGAEAVVPQPQQSLKKAVLQLTLFILLVMPATLAVTSMALGGILAAIEVPPTATSMLASFDAMLIVKAKQNTTLDLRHGETAFSHMASHIGNPYPA